MTKRATQLEPSLQHVLWALYELSQVLRQAEASGMSGPGAGRAGRQVDAGAIARLLDIPVRDVVAALIKLDAAGLVWAERCRLTLPGLALGVGLATKARSRAGRAA